jgi:Flp pilus assembly protein TadG
MKRRRLRIVRVRRGAVAVLVAVLTIPMLGLVSFAIDYGYLLVVRTQMQRAADAAALAAVWDLVPDSQGNQNDAAVRNVARQYAGYHDAGGLVLSVDDSDIQIGRYDPTTIYSGVSLLNSGIQDTVRVTLRRDGTTNASVPLFFARIIGVNTANVTVTGTAVLQKSTILEPGADILPFAVPLSTWTVYDFGDQWSIYGDGKMVDASGNPIPGNWGTVDIGAANNSTADLRAQILNGLRQTDLDALYGDGRIPQNTHIDAKDATWVNADTGLSSGIKSAVQAVHGLTRLVPIFDAFGGSSQGNNLEYRIIGWGVVKVVNSNWQGANNTYVLIQKSYMYDNDLRPQTDLSNENNLVDGAFTEAALVE